MLGYFCTIIFRKASHRVPTGSLSPADFVSIFAGLSIISMLSACNYNIQKNQLSGEMKFAADQQLTAVFIQKSVLATCVHCHYTGGQRPELTTIAMINDNWSDAISDIDQNDMPRPDKGDNPLNDCQKAILHRWADLGHPDSSQVTVGSIQACVNGSTSTPPVTPPVIVLPPNTLVGEQVIQQHVLAVCVHCHGKGGEMPDLTTLANIRTELGDIVLDVNSDDMPRPALGDRPLDACQKAILNKWVELKTPAVSQVTVASLPACTTSSTDHPPANPPVTPAPPVGSLADAPVNYQTFKTHIIDRHCIGCHESSSSSRARGILFQPYTNLVAKQKLFKTPGAGSRFVRLVTRNDKGRMPPMGSSSPPLNDEEVAFVEKWIDAGLPEN